MMWRVLALVSMVLPGLPAVAQSTYGCTDLAGHHVLPAVEGAGGVFFAISSDLAMFPPLGAGGVSDIARLSAALAERGTTLIFVPLPSRALIAPETLPSVAGDLGHDAALAATVHDGIVDRLVAANVIAVNLRLPLRAPAGQPLSLIGTDDRLNSDGGRRAAAAIGAVIAATPGFAALPRTSFTTEVTGQVTLPSPMRDILQRHCTIPLPPAVTDMAATTGPDGSIAATTDALAGSGQAGIVLIGGRSVDPAATNLPGFLAEATGLDVRPLMASDSGVALTAYLTSDAFAASPPPYLVWVQPMADLPGMGSDLQTEEWIAAARGRCDDDLPLTIGPDAGTMNVDLRLFDPKGQAALLVDTGTPDARQARFDLTDAEGMILTRHILRDADLPASGQFFLPLAGFRSGAPTSLRITIDAAVGPDARVSACPEG